MTVKFLMAPTLPNRDVAHRAEVGALCSLVTPLLTASERAEYVHGG